MIDPIRDQLVAELRSIRRMPGLPRVERLSEHTELIEALGMGDVERAWARLLRIRDEHGDDPGTDIGAYFYLAGWKIGRDTLDQRITQYAKQFGCVERTALRRGDRGAAKLAMIIRDQAESARPWGLVTVFQSGQKADVIVRLMLGYESWRPATIRVNGEDLSDAIFALRQNPDVVGGYLHQVIAESVPLDLDAEKSGTMLSVFVHWPMPVWPTWQTVAYVADPRIIVRTRSYRDRGIELRLEWSRNQAARSCGPLLVDQRVWMEDSDAEIEQRPGGWERVNRKRDGRDVRDGR